MSFRFGFQADSPVEEVGRVVALYMFQKDYQSVAMDPMPQPPCQHNPCTSCHQEVLAAVRIADTLHVTRYLNR